MSIARQGVVFLIVIITMNAAFGYLGVVWSQPVSDLITFAIGVGFYQFKFKPLLVE